MIGRLSCGNCNDGKIGFEPNSSVRATCNVCRGCGWMPYWLQNMYTDAQLLESMSPGSLAHFRQAAALDARS